MTSTFFRLAFLSFYSVVPVICQHNSHHARNIIAPKEHFVNGLGMKFVRIQGGSATLGSDKLFVAQPIHKVKLTSFWMSAYETTNLQFERWRRHKRGKDSPGDKEPVGLVSRAEALAFAKWLSNKEGRHYTLPSEAQWEYAALAGSIGTDFPWGNVATEDKFLMSEQRCKPVGSYPPNAYGLYDMVGNIGEIVLDDYMHYEDIDFTKVNPVGKYHGNKSANDVAGVYKGAGVELDTPQVWMRQQFFDEIPLDGVGFRLVCDKP